MFFTDVVCISSELFNFDFVTKLIVLCMGRKFMLHDFERGARVSFSLTRILPKIWYYRGWPDSSGCFFSWAFLIFDWLHPGPMRTQAPKQADWLIISIIILQSSSPTTFLLIFSCCRSVFSILNNQFLFSWRSNIISIISTWANLPNMFLNTPILFLFFFS